MASFLRWMRDARGRRGVFCLPLALMEMETSHYGDKYKSWSSCVEREFIFFLVGGSCFSSQLRLSAFCGRS
jgi:hypothetical protein